MVKYAPRKVYIREISYAKLNWRLGWYKVHYSEQYTKIVEEFINIS
jgi:hypothetical protein